MMNHKLFKKLTSICLILSMVMGVFFGNYEKTYSDIVDSTEYCDVTIPVTYGQTEARTMLSMINDFRTGSEAWYWNL